MGNYKEQNCQLNPKRYRYGRISPANPTQGRGKDEWVDGQGGISPPTQEDEE